MATTLLALARHVALELGYAQGTCSGAGSSTTIVDTSGDSPFDPDDSSNLFASAWAKIEADSAGTPLNVGEVRRVDASGYTPSTGTITVTRAFSNATTATQGYGIYFQVPPTTFNMQKGILQFTNDFLRQRYYKKLFLLTEVPDGDMEATGTTNYSGTNATLAKVTSGTGVTEGDQALQVTTTAASGYCTLATALDCTEGEVVDVCVDVKPTSGSWKLQTWDVTNGAEIDVSNAYSGVQARRLWVRSDIPDGCETFNIRLIGETITTVAAFDSLSVRFVGRDWLNMPSWFIKEDWLEEVWVYPPGTLRENAYDIRDRNRYFIPQWWLERNDTTNQPFRLEWGNAYDIPYGSHVFVESIRPFTELAADTDSTDANADWVRAGVLALIYADKKNKEEALKWALQLKELDKAYNQRASRRVGLRRPY